MSSVPKGYARVAPGVLKGPEYPDAQQEALFVSFASKLTIEEMVCAVRVVFADDFNIRRSRRLQFYQSRDALQKLGSTWYVCLDPSVTIDEAQLYRAQLCQDAAIARQGERTFDDVVRTLAPGKDLSNEADTQVDIAIIPMIPKEPKIGTPDTTTPSNAERKRKGG